MDVFQFCFTQKNRSTLQSVKPIRFVCEFFEQNDLDIFYITHFFNFFVLHREIRWLARWRWPVASAAGRGEGSVGEED